VNGEPRSKHLTNALAGLQAGIVGSLFMLLWYLIVALWTRRSFWTVPNLYATGFYGSDAYVNGFTRASWSGLALTIFLCGIFGAAWGLLWRRRTMPPVAFLGAVAGLIVYYALFNLILPHTRPLIALYAPETQIRIGYLIWGIALSRSPVYARRIAEASGQAEFPG
jgi:hypothetical protein